MSKIRNYLKYSFLLFSKNPTFFILILIELIVMSFSISFTMMYIGSQNTEIKYARKLNCNNAVYYCGDKSNVDELSQVKDVFYKNESVGVFNGKNYNLTSMTYNAFDIIDIPLYKGKWFNKNSNVVEVVVSQGVGKVGEHINIKLENSSLEAVVVGILPKKHVTYRLSGGTTIKNSATLKFLFEPSENNNLIYLNEDKIPDINKEDFYISSSYYINFESSISNEDLIKNINILNDNGYVYKIDLMINNSKTEYNKTLLMIIPIIIFLSVLILFSLILVTYITINNSKKTLATIYLYGGRISDIRGIILFYLLYLVVFSYFIQWILKITLLKNVLKNYGDNKLDMFVLPCVLIIYIVIILISANNSLSKKKIIDSLKERL